MFWDHENNRWGTFGGDTSMFGGAAQNPNGFSGYTSQNGQITQSINGGNGNYAKYEDYRGPSGNGGPSYGETPWTLHNPEGTQIGQGVHKKDKWKDLVAMAGLSAFGMGALGAGMGAGGAASQGMGQVSTMGGMGGGMSSGLGGLGEMSTSAFTSPTGVGGWSAGLDPTSFGVVDTSMFDNALSSTFGVVDSSAMPTTFGVVDTAPWAQYNGYQTTYGAGMPTTGGSEFWQADQASQLPQSPGVPNAPAAPKSIFDNPLIKGLLGPAASAAGGAAGGGAGGGTAGGLGGIISGAIDYGKQNDAVDKMLAYMREAQGKIDSLYAPGSAESKHLWEAMSRKDAKAGRNSQYGTRTESFQAQTADAKGKLTAQLAQALSPEYAKAFGKEASAGSGLATGVGNFLNNMNITDLGKLLEGWFSSGPDVGSK
jgi:hypothetical protein